MVESADTRDLKSLGSDTVPVQVRPPAFFIFAAVVELADTMGLGPIGKPCRFESC